MNRKSLLKPKKKERKNRYSVDDLKCKAIIIITGFSLLRVIRSYDPSCSVSITTKYVMSLGTVSAAVIKSHISEENQCQYYNNYHISCLSAWAMLVFILRSRRPLHLHSASSKNNNIRLEMSLQLDKSSRFGDNQYLFCSMLIMYK